MTSQASWNRFVSNLPFEDEYLELLKTAPPPDTRRFEFMMSLVREVNQEIDDILVDQRLYSTNSANLTEADYAFPSDGLLAPQSTAKWFLENSPLTYNQIASFCHMRPSEVRSLAETDYFYAFESKDPIAIGILSENELMKGIGDIHYRIVENPRVSTASRSERVFRSRERGLATTRAPEPRPIPQVEIEPAPSIELYEYVSNNSDEISSPPEKPKRGWWRR